MANIKIEKGKFAVQFDALGKDGKSAHFRSFYSLKGEPLRIRVPDNRSILRRWRPEWRDRPRSKVRQGIYSSRSFGPHLVFIDKLKSEAQIFVNWRTGSARAYRRIALGQPIFLGYGPKPLPSISDILFLNGSFFIAWMRGTPARADLVLTSIDARTAARRDVLVSRHKGLVTLVSLANIGSNGLIVCHRAMFGCDDSRLDVFPVSLKNTAQPAPLAKS